MNIANVIHFSLEVAPYNSTAALNSRLSTVTNKKSLERRRKSEWHEK